MDYIQLNRFFRTVRVSDHNSEEAVPEIFDKKLLNWEELYSKERVVILAEAGSGKTEELRNSARVLQAQGLFSFFV